MPPANIPDPAQTDQWTQKSFAGSPETRLSDVGHFGPAALGPAPTSAVARRSFGRYEILAEVGRGGMGIVFQARDVTLGRTVALKMLLTAGHSNDKEISRFRAEIEATALLEHRNIVRVYEVGEIEGSAYYTMEYIDGPSLQELLARGPIPGRQAAQYVRTVAQTIHHAHCQGILHRDLKPSNVLMDSGGEPRVADFGLAKQLGSGADQTRTGDIVGTASYMAPEQAAGKNKEQGPAVDVYGLGAILYELLTGRPPFRADSPLETLLQVAECHPAPPRLLNPKVERDLETICLKCLEKAPADRYPSAEALADDLNRYLAGDLISARNINLLARLGKALGHSHHDVEFSRWGSRILMLAGIVFGAQVLVFWLTLRGSPHFSTCVVGVRVVQFILMAVTIMPAARSAISRTPAEKQLWAIWLGFLASCILMALLGRTSIGPRLPAEELAVYGAWSVLSGLAFIVMGSGYWGRCYLFGFAFFVLAVFMQTNLTWAPLEFGLLWGGILVTTGLHLRQLGKDG